MSRNNPFFPTQNAVEVIKSDDFFLLLIHMEGITYHFAVENYTYVC